MGIPSNGASAKMVDMPIVRDTQRPGYLASLCHSHESLGQADNLPLSFWPASAPSCKNGVTSGVAFSFSIVK